MKKEGKGKAHQMSGKEGTKMNEANVPNEEDLGCDQVRVTTLTSTHTQSCAHGVSQNVFFHATNRHDTMTFDARKGRQHARFRSLQQLLGCPRLLELRTSRGSASRTQLQSGHLRREICLRMVGIRKKRTNGQTNWTDDCLQKRRTQTLHLWYAGATRRCACVISRRGYGSGMMWLGEEMGSKICNAKGEWEHCGRRLSSSNSHFTCDEHT